MFNRISCLLVADLKIDLPGLPKPLPRLPLPDLFSGFTPPIGLPELTLEYPGLPRLPDIPGFNVSLPGERRAVAVAVLHFHIMVGT